MAQTIRRYWLPCQGRCLFNLNWDAINRDSVVVVTASEYRKEGDDPDKWTRFVGSASIGVDNISPHGPPDDLNHGVTFVVSVDYKDHPLFVVTDITVLDHAPVDIEVQPG